MRPRRHRRSAAATGSEAKTASDDQSKHANQESDNEESGSEWEGDNGSPSSSDESYDDPQSAKPKASSKRKDPPSKRSPRKRKRPRASEFLDSDNDDEEAVPTYARKTEKGGYSHTNKSKARISRANKGNTPWNKEKGWSAEVKARISAGVKARNRKILLVKLKKLGISEEEWSTKRRKVKLLREKVRKRKVMAKKYEEELQQWEKQKQHSQLMQQIEPIPPAPPESSSEEETEEEEQMANPREEKEDPAVQRIFAREIYWTRHPFDQKEHVYQQKCPEGGPGGLICCEACTASYSGYLTRTATDIESQTTARLKGEVQEIMGFLHDARTELQQAVQAARKKPPPPKPAIAKASTQQKAANGVASAAGTKNVSDDVNWDLTNAMDLGGLGPTAKV